MISFSETGVSEETDYHLKLGFQMVVCFFHALISLVTQHLKGEPQKAQVLSLLLVILCGILS